MAVQEAPSKTEDCDIFEDNEGRETKQKIVRSMRGETLLHSISNVMSFGAGPVFGAGIVLGIGLAAKGMTAAIASHLGIGAVLAAGVTSFGVVAAGIVAVGALMMVAAVAADFISTRIYQDKQLDMQEFNAKRTGHHIAAQWKQETICEDQGRSQDWIKYVETRRQQNTAANR